MLVIAAAVAVTVWTTYLLSTWPPEPPSGSPAAASVEPSGAAESSPSPEATQDGPTVLVVVGDSFSAGTDQNSGPEWPEQLGERLGWEVVVEAAPRTTVVLASPFSNGAPGPVTTRLAKRLEAVARDVEATYLDLTDYLPFGSDLIGDDGVHPSDKGHRRIARLLEQDLTEADLRGP